MEEMLRNIAATVCPASAAADRLKSRCHLGARGSTRSRRGCTARPVLKKQNIIHFYDAQTAVTASWQQLLQATVTAYFSNEQLLLSVTQNRKNRTTRCWVWASEDVLVAQYFHLPYSKARGRRPRHREAYSLAVLLKDKKTCLSQFYWWH